MLSQLKVYRRLSCDIKTTLESPEPIELSNRFVHIHDPELLSQISELPLEDQQTLLRLHIKDRWASICDSIKDLEEKIGDCEEFLEDPGTKYEELPMVICNAAISSRSCKSPLRIF